jgi:very-short-patch-repair endonuclease
MRPKGATPDLLVGLIASRQHGVISVAQILGTGMSRDAIKWRVAAGRFHRIHRGVYAVGHEALSNEGRWMAAVLACGDGAALSHRSAAELWGLLEPRERAWVHVTVPTSAGRRKQRGIHLHRSPLLQSGTLTTKRREIRVTTPARTIADLKRTAPGHEVRRAIRQAEIRGLRLDHPTDGTRSNLERLFLRICARHRIPEPEVNVKLDPYTVDFLWPEAKLAVEVDSWIYHRGRQAFREDRARDQYLRRRGYRVARYSDHLLETDPAGVAADIRALLA